MCRVVATDVDGFGILERIRGNILLNSSLHKTEILVKPCDLKINQFSEWAQNFDIIMVGDIIYDDDITNAFIAYLESVWSVDRRVEVLVCLEKRFVFTLQHLDTVAPAYDYFTNKLAYLELKHALRIQYLPVDFKQCFCYDRGEHMVLISIICD